MQPVNVTSLLAQADDPFESIGVDSKLNTMGQHLAVLILFSILASCWYKVNSKYLDTISCTFYLPQPFAYPATVPAVIAAALYSTKYLLTYSER